MHIRGSRWMALLLLLTIGSVVHAQGTPTPTGPRIVVPQDRFEFEPVPEGSEVTHQFSVKNSGDAPLLIERVRTG